jgi:hypothetical protein
MSNTKAQIGSRVFIPANIGWTKQGIVNHVNSQRPLIEDADRLLTVDDINDDEAQTFVDIMHGHLVNCSDGSYDNDDAMAEAEYGLLMAWVNSLISLRKGA